MLGSCRLELIDHEDIDHEGLNLCLLDELGGLIILELHENVITNLGFRGELKQVTHEIGNLTLIKEATFFDINDTEGILYLCEIEFFLAFALNWVLGSRQHI